MERRIVKTCFGDMYVDGDRLVSVGDENLYYSLPDNVWTAEEIQEFCEKLKEFER